MGQCERNTGVQKEKRNTHLLRWRTYPSHHKLPQEATLWPIFLQQEWQSSREHSHLCHLTLPIQEPPASSILVPCTQSLSASCTHSDLCTHSRLCAPSITFHVIPHLWTKSCTPSQFFWKKWWRHSMDKGHKGLLVIDSTLYTTDASKIMTTLNKMSNGRRGAPYAKT